MPVFTETSSSWRDLRTLPSSAPPLPRLTPPLVINVAEEVERYEVVVIGVSQKLGMYRGSSTDVTNPRQDQRACFSLLYSPVMDCPTSL